MRRDSNEPRDVRKRAKLSWKRKILCTAVAGAMPLMVGCASSVKESRQIGNGSWMERPVVLSGRPDHDTVVHNATEEQLSEADWKVLEALGPKAIWDRLNEISKASKERRAAAAAGSGSSTSLAKAATTRSTRTAEEIAAETPAIPLPDGKIRLIYALQNYGGTTVTAATDSGTSRRTVTAKAPDLTPLVSALAAQLGDGSTVAPLPNENTLIITCAPNMKDSVLAMLAQLDQPPRQVEITAKMFEVSHDFDFQYGCQILLNRVAADGTQSALSSFSTKQFANSLAQNGTTPPTG
jgi:type II secretory pathway component GspD/PulD (secretin)